MSQIKFADELLLQFDQLNADFSDNAFTTGDLACNVVDEYTHAFEHADILRNLADQTHIQYDSLRDRERVSRAVSHDARLQYPLSFHQWRALVRKDIDPIPDAEWCVSQDKLPTVAEIYRHMQGFSNEPQWLKKFMQMQKLASAILKDSNAPAHVIEMCMDIMPVQACPPLP
jgi:hypothetical protein